MGIEVIHNWSAKRAGGRITITGVDAFGRPFHMAGFDRIEATDASPTEPLATHNSGVVFRLGHFRTYAPK